MVSLQYTYVPLTGPGKTRACTPCRPSSPKPKPKPRPGKSVPGGAIAGTTERSTKSERALVVALPLLRLALAGTVPWPVGWLGACVRHATMRQMPGTGGGHAASDLNMAKLQELGLAPDSRDAWADSEMAAAETVQTPRRTGHTCSATAGA